MDETLRFVWVLLGIGVFCGGVGVGIASVLQIAAWMTGVPDHDGHDIPDVVHGHWHGFYPEIEDVDLDADTNIDLPDVEPTAVPTHGVAVDDDTGEWETQNQGRVELPENDEKE